MKTVKEIRQEKGISATFLADRLGISTVSFSNKENGKAKFNLVEALFLAQHLGVKMDEIDWRFGK